MIAYIKCAPLGAVSIEWSKSLGATPILKIGRHGKETICDLPYTRIICTPKTCFTTCADKNKLYE